MELPAFNDRESEAYLERFIREDAKKSLSPEMFQRQIDLVVKNCQVGEGKDEYGRVQKSMWVCECGSVDMNMVVCYSL